MSNHFELFETTIDKDTVSTLATRSGNVRIEIDEDVKSPIGSGRVVVCYLTRDEALRLSAMLTLAAS